VLVYRNYPLEAKNENITRAVVFVHGINRDADNHFRTVLAAAFLSGALNNTVLVAPRFASNSKAPGNRNGNCRDALAPDEVNWICETQRADSWRSGGGEVGSQRERPTSHCRPLADCSVKSIGLLLFFVLRTFRPVVRILPGLLAGFALWECIISFDVAWYQNWPAKFLWTGGRMLSASVVCSVFLWYYDMLTLRLTPEGVVMVLFN